MNTIVLIGRLARNPETKLASTQKGQTKVSRFPLVVKRNRTSKAFVVMITAYGNNAEFVSCDTEEFTEILGKLLGGKQTSKMTAHLEALEELLTEEEYKGRVNNLSDIR